LQLGVARELGYTLSELVTKITLEELYLWSAYFDYLNEEQDAAVKRARYR
tara:strand:+ start:777 stop:926 length:150 start_codon:yes stop_codon:yes gene_type:complete